MPNVNTTGDNQNPVNAEAVRLAEIRRLERLEEIERENNEIEEESGDDEVDYRNIDMDSGEARASYVQGTLLQSPRKFGIELEMQFEERGYGARASTLWPSCVGVESDGSIAGFGLEVQTPPVCGKVGEELVTNICKIADKCHATVDNSCGYHVHIDMRELSSLPGYRKLEIYKQLLLFYISYEDVLLSFLPESRRMNDRYCSPLRTEYHYKEIENCSTIGQLEKLWYRARTSKVAEERKSNKKDSSRYKGINLHTLLSAGHLEVRYHSGTINARKVLEWSNLHLVIADYIENAYRHMSFTRDCNTIDLAKKTNNFFNMIQLNKDSEAYFRGRQNKFTPSTKASNPIITVEAVNGIENTLSSEGGLI